MSRKKYQASLKFDARNDAFSSFKHTICLEVVHFILSAVSPHQFLDRMIFWIIVYDKYITEMFFVGWWQGIVRRRSDDRSSKGESIRQSSAKTGRFK
jgi:purine-cytosine permease-like protein